MDDVDKAIKEQGHKSDGKMADCYKYPKRITLALLTMIWNQWSRPELGL